MTDIPFKILYVGTGNTARSALAAAFARRFVSNGAKMPYEIDSVGTEAVDGDPPPPDLNDVASSFGVDISTHRARALTLDGCAEPDLILAMSWNEMSHLWSLAPDAWPKSFTLREFIHWAERAPKRPKILFPDNVARMRDRVAQAHAIRKRARADEGFWGGMRPEDLDVPDLPGEEQGTWHDVAKQLESLVGSAIRLCGGP